ncbi:MAG: holin family protein [Alphaproteobacteria bacterium]|nr:holin family protein [Rhodospirillales bacterium]MCW9045793.1 holin family protein [Alphaproteobacteria bacterium]
MLSLIAPLVGGLFGVIDKAIEDKDQAARIKATIQEQVLSGELKELETAASIIIAEAQGESWLQRNWRPMLMCLFGVIIANNYLIVPLLGTPLAEIPSDMWDLLKLGLGGYVIGRSAEKGVKAWKQKN